MASSNPAVWDMVKQLWIQGIKADLIAERCGVSKQAVTKRAWRHKWNDLRTSTAQFLVKQSAPMLAESVAQASIKARKRLSEHLATCVDTLEAPTSFHDAAKQQAMIEPMIRNAEKLFQWSQAGQSSMVSIQSLSQDAQVGQLSDGPAAPMIDVTPVPSDTPSTLPVK